MAVKKLANEGRRKFELFKTHKTSPPPPPPLPDTVTPSDDVAHAIDMFRKAQEQALHFEGEALVYKDTILHFAEDEYVRRLMEGAGSSFKILGAESQVTYIATDASSGLSDEDVELIIQRWGKQAADELIMHDFRTIRFDEKVLEAHYDEVVEALQALPVPVLEKLFKPMLMKTKPGAVDTAKRYAKNRDDLKALLRYLKVKHYLK
jgi:hypothetical protein